MIQYAIIATLIGIAAIAANAWQFRRNRRKVADISAELNEVIRASQAQRKEIERLHHIIAAEQEVIRDANRKKNDIRDHADPVDRANAATDLMSDLAQGGDGN